MRVICLKALSADCVVFLMLRQPRASLRTRSRPTLRKIFLHASRSFEIQRFFPTRTGFCRSNGSADQPVGLFTLLLFTLDALTAVTTVWKRLSSQMICRLMLIHSAAGAEQAQISTRCSEEPLPPLEQWSVVGFHSFTVSLLSRWLVHFNGHRL